MKIKKKRKKKKKCKLAQHTRPPVWADVLNPNLYGTNVLEMAGYSDRDGTETDPVGAH